MLTAKQPVHYGYKSVHDLPTPPSTSRLSPPLAYQEPARKRLPSIPRSHSPPDQHLMSAPHRGLPMPAAMTLPPQQSHASSASGPPPPPLPPASQPGLSSSISSLSAHAQHHLGQLPGPPPQWQGAEESMRSWLTAKAEEDRRKQEEERTKQESLRLEQRRIEADMLRTSLQGGIPPPIVPLVFAGMGGAVSPTALDIAQQYIASQGHGAHPQLMSTQGGQRSPEHRRDSQSHGYGPYTGVPSTPVSAPGPHGYAAYPGSPQTRGRAQTLSSTGSTGRAVGPSSNLPSLNTGAPPAGQSQSSMHGHVHGGHAPSQQLSGQQESQQQQQSPGIYFHHWQPPTSQAGSSNQPATPSGEVGESPRNKRKATDPQQAAPMPSQQQHRFRSPPVLFKPGATLSNPPPSRRRGQHSRRGSDQPSYRMSGLHHGERSGTPRASSPVATGPALQHHVNRIAGGHSVSSLLSEEPSSMAERDTPVDRGDFFSDTTDKGVRFSAWGTFDQRI
ncbi:uncharacterized protein VDAG_03913 [Verticillium dahliae VdLs.17]|uniref:Uncharacterized protein n=1 Tax=Verticillium dahliae (strain VdLs.17 / ATCC MYA-4575 / FGSC 10137) TaxID=498257 RepID=G2X0Y4_VERDV|nr:uncharacterized protein VDAG_03913 [Verticillium dahliae VdLs.17]EGY22475.1 hypothetical protein VDAG_03913 [Verticillium dahliae VdLs.17]